MIHLLALISWFAGIFYIWRLYVYHAMATEQAVKDTFVVMERKLIAYIIRPAMFVTILFGFALLGHQWAAFTAMWWIWIKIGLVVLLLVNHAQVEYYRRKLAGGASYNHRLFRIQNEVPTVLLIFIVILAVLKPF